MYDIGGSEQVLPIWKYYSKGISAIVYVISTFNEIRIEANKLII
jgi:hypothetical protein